MSYIPLVVQDIHTRVRSVLGADRVLEHLDRVRKDSDLPILSLYSSLDRDNVSYKSSKMSKREEEEFRERIYLVDSLLWAERKVELAKSKIEGNIRWREIHEPRLFRGGYIMSKLGWGWSNPNWERVRRENRKKREQLDEKMREWKRLMRNEPLDNFDRLIELSGEIQALSN